LQLRLNNLSCERDERTLFSGLSAEFSAGEVVQIAGANGAGKTTLLRIICGLSSFHEGEVTWLGKSSSSYEFRSSVLYLGHAPGLNASLTPMENLKWFYGLCGMQSPAAVEQNLDTLIRNALANTGMRGYEDVPCRQLSAGQQRRVSLARLYCSQAPLWVLDEPFTAIDKSGVELLEQRFAEHALNGGIVMLTSHQPLNIDNVRCLDLT